MESRFNAVELRELRDARGPAPASAGCSSRGFENASYQQDEVQAQQGGTLSTSCPASTSGISKLEPQQQPDASQRPYDEEEGTQEEGQDFAAYNPAEDHTADYGFIFALVFLVSGIVLVVIAYTIPREAKVDPDSVSARQMEKLEMYYAQLGSHLDKCIIAGLGLLTLGGMFLSVLLMVSICRGEMHRRRAAFVRPKRTYGSINLRMKQLAMGEALEGSDGGEELLVEQAETRNNAQLGPSRDSRPQPGPSLHPPAPSAAAHGAN